MSKSSIRVVQADMLPKPNGHYSHAVVHGGLVYVSGQLGRGPTMSDEEAGDIDRQARRALTAFEEILRAADSDVSRLLKVTVYIPDVALWPRVDAVYAGVMGAHRPARAVVPTGRLHFEALIEVEGIAALAGD